ncbi:unnamed protein product [Cuscuta europaea]|uniref:Uncharacterized protein n=1 Tax=Cuscuta europaea TaxID=41803 RepID=A0A9P0ZPZ0_CUSEU|nr:unnamed protein product [Cuscuta europaea]
MSKNEEVMDDFDVDEGLDDLGQCPKRRQKTTNKMMLKKFVDDKVVVKVNRFGVHAGKEWTELANYIGVVVRDHEWRHVAVKLKEEMWNHLKELFVLSENSKKHVLATMSDGVYGSKPQDTHTQKNRKHKTLSGALVGQGTPAGRKGTNSEYGPESKEPGCPRRPRPRRPRRPHRTGFYTYSFV